MMNPASPFAEATVESSKSDVAWAAIFAGALTAIAITLILTPLGAGLGFTEYNPWHPHAGKAMTAMEVIWLIIIQWVSAGLGGYLTGRLRTKWVGAHTHEVYFRDTVHGFLAWALAAALGATLLATVAMHMGSHMMGKNYSEDSARNYYTAALFRPEPGVTPAPAPTPADTGLQALPPNNASPTGASPQDMMAANHILEKGVMEGQISDEDRSYLAGLVSARAGVSQSDANARIDSIMTRQKTELDKTRKAAAGASFAICLTLLLGAFIASLAGALGGAHRDVFYEHGRFSLD